MSKRTTEIRDYTSPDSASEWVTAMWSKFNNQRNGIKQDWLETAQYIFATDTTTTTNKKLPWRNSTTIPKLCQIRDNLHSNYMSSLLPNDEWLTWLPNEQESAKSSISKLICGFLQYKLRQTDFRTVLSKLVLDYIDYGNSFATVVFDRRMFESEEGEMIPQYIGARLQRISPYDIVFDATAASFDEAPKIVRSMKSVGEIIGLGREGGDNNIWADFISDREDFKNHIMGNWSSDDFEKANMYSVDGFGNLFDYYASNMVEILDYYGDFYDKETNTLHQNMHVIIADRRCVVYKGKCTNWFGKSPIMHAGWRKRSDNLWAMSPLANLVGLQYRLDHLENLKADAMDLMVHPPLVIKGEVGEFEWQPGEEIHIDGDGDISELGKSANGILTARSEMADIEARMELYAGAPREAMGIRSPGEKTAFEVQVLDNAANRIFLEKCVQFEVELLEPSMNMMLEESIRNFDPETVPIIDPQTGATLFQSITKEDITFKGTVRPVGARYFAKKHQDLQNLIGVMNSPIAAIIQPHMSSKALKGYIEDSLNLRGYEIFQDFIALQEQAEMQQMQSQMQEEQQVQNSIPALGTIDTSGVEQNDSEA